MEIAIIALAGYAMGKWLVWRINYMALMLWIVGEDIEPPTKAEMGACIKQVVRRGMGLK